jgi:hypothetical protein
MKRSSVMPAPRLSYCSRYLGVSLASRRWFPYGSDGGPEPELRAVAADSVCLVEGLLWLPRPGPFCPDTRYWIYANHGDGGPIDRARPVAGPFDAPGWIPALLSAPGRFSFLVRSFDPCGRIEYGLDCVVDLVLGDQGEAVPFLPDGEEFARG